MPWVKIEPEEYRDLYNKDEDRLSVFSCATFLQGYFPEDYIETTWRLDQMDIPYIKSLKKGNEWNYWKWEEK